MSLMFFFAAGDAPSHWWERRQQPQHGKQAASMWDTHEGVQPETEELPAAVVEQVPLPGQEDWRYFQGRFPWNIRHVQPVLLVLLLASRGPERARHVNLLPSPGEPHPREKGIGSKKYLRIPEEWFLGRSGTIKKFTRKAYWNGGISGVVVCIQCDSVIVIVELLYKDEICATC